MDQMQKQTLLKVARDSVEAVVTGRTGPKPESDEAELRLTGYEVPSTLVVGERFAATPEKRICADWFEALVLHAPGPGAAQRRLFLRSGALAVRGGMSEAGALRALTLNPARMMRLDERIGSIEVGKDADLVLLSGPPFGLYTQVLETWIEGKRVFDRSDPVQRRSATGGFAVGDAYPKAPAGAQ